MEDQNAEFSAAPIPHQSGHVELPVAVEVSELERGLDLLVQLQVLPESDAAELLPRPGRQHRVLRMLGLGGAADARDTARRDSGQRKRGEAPSPHTRTHVAFPRATRSPLSASNASASVST